MIIDSRLEFSDQQALTASAASTNVIDLGQDRDIGVGRSMFIVITLDVAADDSDADETYSFAVQTDDNESFSSPTTLGTIVFTRGDAAGTKRVFVIGYENERYLRLYYTLGGTSPSVTVSAFLTDQPPFHHAVYPNAVV